MHVSVWRRRHASVQYRTPCSAFTALISRTKCIFKKTQRNRSTLWRNTLLGTPHRSYITHRTASQPHQIQFGHSPTTIHRNYRKTQIFTQSAATMKCIAVAVVVVALAVSAVHSGIVLGAGGLVLPPLSYTAQTVDLNGVQATVVAGQPARLVAAAGVPILAGSVLGGTVVTSAGTVQVAGAPAIVQLAGVPAGIQLVQSPAAVVQTIVPAEG